MHPVFVSPDPIYSVAGCLITCCGSKWRRPSALSNVCVYIHEASPQNQKCLILPSPTFYYRPSVSVSEMKRFWGLRGSRLNIATILMVVCPAYLCYGYNQAVTGGVLTLESFVKVFPQLDTINTTGSQNTYNENIQGLSSFCCCVKRPLTHILRYRHGNVHHWRCVWRAVHNAHG